MNQISPNLGPRRVAPVEPDLMRSAVFLMSEHLARLADEAESTDEDEPVDIDTRAVLDNFAEELGTDVPTTLNLYLRVTALFRLLAQSPSLAKLAMELPEQGGELSDNAVVAAARLDLDVRREGAEGSADFDAREFRAALDAA